MKVLRNTLYNLAGNCEYGALLDEMIRDRLIVGIRDSRLSERLQTESELTLEKTKKIVRQKEAVHGQQMLLKTESIEAVQNLRRKGKPIRMHARKDTSRSSVDVAEEIYTAEINVLPKMPHTTNVTKRTL